MYKSSKSLQSEKVIVFALRTLAKKKKKKKKSTSLKCNTFFFSLKQNNNTYNALFSPCAVLLACSVQLLFRPSEFNKTNLNFPKVKCFRFQGGSAAIYS